MEFGFTTAQEGLATSENVKALADAASQSRSGAMIGPDQRISMAEAPQARIIHGA